MGQRWVLKRGFDRVFAGRRSVSGRLLAVRWVSAPGDGCHVGISVARRVGNAVQRNRVKRRLRAIMRELLPQMDAEVDIVIVARPGCGEASFSDIRGSVQELLARAGILNGNQRWRPDGEHSGTGLSGDY